MPKKGTPAAKSGQKLGQHFLFDGAILERIADTAGLTTDDVVLEIGPGPGGLTEVLARRAGRVVAVELDSGLIPRLNERMAAYDNFTLVQGDILRVNLAELWRDQLGGRPFKVVANLPYYITTPILMAFLESDLPVVSLTVMVQKEVADRLVAPPGGREYGAISVAVQWRTEARRAFLVPASAFVPPPRVESAVLHLTVRQEPAVAVADPALFRQVVRVCFASRRKTLRNNISLGFGLGGDDAAALLASAGIDPKERAERLGLPEFAALTDAVARWKNGMENKIVQ